MDYVETIFIFLMGFLASFIGINVGGGSLISIPVLIFLGLPPHIAIATNKLASLGLVTAGTYQFARKGKLHPTIGTIGFILTLIGAFFGARVLLLVPEELITKLVGILILIVLALVIINNHAGLKHKKVSVVLKHLRLPAFLLFGFWGAFFGGGFGVFSIYSLIVLYGLTFVESAAVTSLLGVGIALVAIPIYWLSGSIDMTVAIPLLIGMTAGAYTGAAYGIKKGNHWLRKLFIIVSVLSALRLLF